MTGLEFLGVGVAVVGLMGGGVFLVVSLLGTLIEGRPILAVRWLRILLGAFAGLFPLNLRGVPFQGAELALRLYEGDPEGQSRFIHIYDTIYKGTWAEALLPGAQVKLTPYQTWRAVRATRSHNDGVARAAQEKAALAFAQDIINRAHKKDTF